MKSFVLTISERTVKRRDHNYKVEQLQYKSEKGKTQLQKSDPKQGVGSTLAESRFSMKRTFIQVVNQFVQKERSKDAIKRPFYVYSACDL